MDDLITAPVVYGILQPGPNLEEGVPYIRPTEIENDTIQTGALRRTSTAIAGRYERSKIAGSDVILSIVGTIGKVAIVPSEIAGGNITQSSARLRFNQLMIDSRYAAWALRSPILRHQYDNARLGTAVPRLNIAHVRSLEIPVAPVKEQLRIVAKVEELISDLDAGVAALERAKANLKRYRAAVLKAAVEGKLTEVWRAKHPHTEPASKLLDRILAERRRMWEADQLAKYAAAGKEPPKNWKEKYIEPTPPDTEGLPELSDGWRWATIHQLNSAERPISYGVLQPGSDLEDGIPLVRVCDIADGKVAVEEMKRIAPEISEQFRRTILQGGEVLLTVVGTIGRTAIAPPELAGANTARAVAVIAVVPPCDSHFLELTLRETSMRARLMLAAHEVARKTLNLEDVRVAVVPLPPLEEQKEILQEVAEKLSQIDAAQVVINHGLLRAARLRQSILKQAFEGRLVPQDPTDEPASLLLERPAAKTVLLREATLSSQRNEENARLKERPR